MLLRYHSLLLVTMAALASDVGAQAAPPALTEVFLVTVRRSGAALTFGAAQNITRRAGYDNQPAFTPDGTGVLFTSVRDGQADIYRYDVARRSTRRLTKTPESEYSATIMPGDSSFSVIRVEADSKQRLWAFPLRGTGAPWLVLERVQPVGYQAWADAHSLALFILGQPATLRRADTRTGDAETVAENIGRAMQKVPGRRAVSFIQIVPADSSMWIKMLDFETGNVTSVVQTLAGSEYHVWLPDGALLMAQGASLYRYDPRQDNASWSKVATFTQTQLQRITRLALSPKGDRLAMVGEPAPRPRATKVP